MPGLAVLPVVILLLQVPAATTQILASAAFALVVVLGVACVWQWRAARHWDRVLQEYAERDIARRREPARRDQPAAHLRKPPPRRTGDSGGPKPCRKADWSG